MKDFIECFNRKYKFRYLGYVYIPFDEDSEPYMLVENFIKELDKKVKPWWCPRWFLNLLHLYGNDNSIVRVRNWFLHRLLKKIIGYYLITDIKTKFGGLRVYGYWDDETEKRVDRLCDEVDKYIEPHY